MHHAQLALVPDGMYLLPGTEATTCAALGFACKYCSGCSVTTGEPDTQTLLSRAVLPAAASLTSLHSSVHSLCACSTEAPKPGRLPRLGWQTLRFHSCL